MANLQIDSEHLLRLQDNASWRHYVQTLSERYDRAIQALLLSDFPDESLRGEARALFKELQFIDRNTRRTS